VLWGFCANHAIGVRHTLDVYWFVTMEDGLFFSYLLSRQTPDGEKGKTWSQSAPPYQDQVWTRTGINSALALVTLNPTMHDW